MLRLQLVYLGGALDFYFHELIRYCLLEMFIKRWTRSSSFKKISVPLIDVENAYFDTKNPFDDETSDWFFILIEKIYHRSTYQGYDGCKQALKILEIPISIIAKNIS